MLYFGDPQQVQRHLHQDLNTIIKNVKQRQQQCLELLQYNKSIATKRRNLQSTIFIEKQMQAHTLYLQQVQSTHSNMLKQQAQIHSKYNQAIIHQHQGIIRLMFRVCGRILETNQSYLNKSRQQGLGLGLEQGFNKMKTQLTRLVSNKEQIDLGLAVKVILQYVGQKVEREIERLKRLIKSLENGEFDKIGQAFSGNNNINTNSFKNQRQSSTSSIISLKKPSQTTAIIIKNHIGGSTVPSVPTNASSNTSQPFHTSLQKRFPSSTHTTTQKTNRIKIQLQLQQQQKLKTQKKKIANKMLNTTYSTMDLSKKQFMQDMVFVNAKQQYNRIYSDIYARNKFNRDQIIEFEHNEERFVERVNAFKEQMLVQSQRINEVLLSRIPSVMMSKKKNKDKDKDKNINHNNNKNNNSNNKIQKTLQNSQSSTSSFTTTTVNIKTNPQQKTNQKIIFTKQPTTTTTTTNTSRKSIFIKKVTSPRFYKVSNTSQLSQLHITQQSFNHIRFDTPNNQIFHNRNNINNNSYNNNNRYVLPLIHQKKGYSSSSFEHRYNSHLAKMKQRNSEISASARARKQAFKQEKDKNLNTTRRYRMKNIEVVEVGGLQQQQQNQQQQLSGSISPRNGDSRGKRNQQRQTTTTKTTTSNTATANVLLQKYKQFKLGITNNNNTNNNTTNNNTTNNINNGGLLSPTKTRDLTFYSKRKLHMLGATKTNFTFDEYQI